MGYIRVIAHLVTFYQLPGTSKHGYQKVFTVDGIMFKLYLFVAEHLSSVENPGWLFYTRDYTTQLYGNIGNYNKPL